jgi:hypothetical protein
VGKSPLIDKGNLGCRERFDPEFRVIAKKGKKDMKVAPCSAHHDALVLFFHDIRSVQLE